MIRSYEVWSAGDGYDIPTVNHGIGKGETFREACKELFDRKNAMRGPFAPKDTLYNEVDNTYYGCRLYHNNIEARASEMNTRYNPKPKFANELVTTIREALDKLSEMEANSGCNDEDKADAAYAALGQMTHRLLVAEQFVSDAGWKENDGGFS